MAFEKWVFCVGKYKINKIQPKHHPNLAASERYTFLSVERLQSLSEWQVARTSYPNSHNSLHILSVERLQNSFPNWRPHSITNTSLPIGSSSSGSPAMFIKPSLVKRSMIVVARSDSQNSEPCLSEITNPLLSQHPEVCWNGRYHLQAQRQDFSQPQNGRERWSN